MAMATVCLFVRSCWRVAELSGGFNGPLASKEGIFIALDSAPMSILSILLTLFHPGLLSQKKEESNDHQRRDIHHEKDDICSTSCTHTGRAYVDGV